jgi:hypothetical protein
VDLVEDYRVLIKQNLVSNKIERINQEKIDYIIEEYTMGKSSTIIAKEMILDSRSVIRILKKNNIAIRPSEINKRTYNID